MLRRHLSILLALTVAASCSDDNGKDKDAGPDMNVPTDGMPDKTVATPDAKADTNVAGKPVIDNILPADGFADATTPVVLTGKNFAAGATILIDGGAGEIIQVVVVASPVSLSFTMPKNPYGPPYDKPQKVSVAVMVNQVASNAVDFQYTVTKAMDATFKGSVLQTSPVSAFRDFASDPVEAQVLAQGITDTSTGDSGKLTAEIGFGTVGKDPSKEPGFKWLKARFNRDEASGYDVYDAALTVPLSQTYDVAFRFSQDGGQSWIYADTDEADLSYQTAKAAKITAIDPPVGYCQTDGDCSLQALKVVCLIDAADKTKNQCVECKADADCTGNPKALGPKCETTQYMCYCQQATDCTSNPNGHNCLSSGYCGCQADTDCPSGGKCVQTPDGLTICGGP